MAESQDRDQELSRLQALREQMQEAGLSTAEIDARIAEHRARAMVRVTDGGIAAGGDITITGGEVAGRDLIKIYIESTVSASERSEVRRVFREYLGAVWERLVNLPMLAVTERGVGRQDVPLTAVYTALDIETVVGTRGGREFPEGMAERIRAQLRGDPVYLARLEERVAREAEEAKAQREDRPYSRRITALEAVAACPRLVLIGPAGSGKSTFAKYLALCLAGQHLGKPEANLLALNGLSNDAEAADPEWLPWPHGAGLPIFVELRRLVKSPCFPAEGTEAGAKHLLDYLEREGEFAAPLRDYLRRDGGALLVLDGLDEVPQAEQCRERLRAVITGFTERYPGCRVLVTSRPPAYVEGSPWRLDDAGFTEETLAPFDDRQIQLFVESWYTYVARRGQIGTDLIAERVQDLWHDLQGLRYLAERPLMLTMMADLHASAGGRLPGGRAELYERSVALLLDRWNEQRGVIGPATLDLGMTLDEIRDALEELAYNVHHAHGSGAEAADITSGELMETLDRHRSGERPVDYREVLDTLQERSGILVSEAPTQYRFPHRSYQEFLAACHLSDEGFPDLLADLVRGNPNQWREVMLYAAGRTAKSASFTAWALIETLVPVAPPDPLPAGDDPAWYAALFAGQAILESELHVRVQTRDRAKLERVRLWLRRALESGALPPVDRAAAGRALAVLGDDRPGVCAVDDNGVPAIDWVTVPAGPFLMGSTEEELAYWQATVDGEQIGEDVARIWKDMFEAEKPQHTVGLPAFCISRYPVTNAQYEAFVKDGGYTEKWRACWTGAGWAWKGDREGPSRRDWHDAEVPDDFLLPNHPRVNVTWYEAHAFSQWLGAKLSIEVRLPTEAEWEKTARGTDGWRYSWGDEFDASRCNAFETGIEQISAVGTFPDGASPYEVQDMGGNVWEWCRSQYRDYPYEAADGREDISRADNIPRVLRGGAQDFRGRLVRCAFRGRLDPDYVDWGLGFRVCAPSGSPL